MKEYYARSRAVLVRRPCYPMLAAFPVVSFTLALLTDIAYWLSADLMWKHFSEWLLLAGIVMAVVAAIVAAIEFALRPHLRDYPPALAHVVGLVVAVLLAILNSFVHAGDGWTAVVPYGLLISAVTVAVLVAADLAARASVLYEDRRAAT